jgi:hypothetical protein
MPNWCANSLRLTASDSRGRETLDAIRIELAKDEPRLFNSILPVPASLQIVAGKAGLDGSPEQTALEQAEASNRDAYGYANWYEFCTHEWGTKWEADWSEADIDDNNGDTITMHFDTAWSPPIGIYQELVDAGLDVQATYCECGFGYAGWWVNGEDNEFDSVSFNDEDDEEHIDDVERMQAWFASESGLNHAPAHCGG